MNGKLPQKEFYLRVITGNVKFGLESEDVESGMRAQDIGSEGERKVSVLAISRDENSNGKSVRRFLSMLLSLFNFGTSFI